MQAYSITQRTSIIAHHQNKVNYFCSGLENSAPRTNFTAS